MTAPSHAVQPEVSKRWRKLLALLPGYDCFRDATGFWFDEDAADHVVEFFETRLCHTEGALCGRPLLLQPWQKAFLGAIFGWKNAAGLRRYREVLLYVPRKNGKTTIIAGIALYMLFCEGEGGQQIFSAAADKKQARIAHTMAKRIIRRDPEMDAMANILKESIELDDHHYNILSCGAGSLHGLNVNCALIDEVHEHPNRELADTIVSSMGARTQPLTVYTTTADQEGETYCNEIHEYFSAVRDGVYCKAQALPVIYEVPQDADWKLERTWRAANPNLGVSVSLEFLREECDKARKISSYQNVFRRLYLNQKTQALDVWIDLDEWDKCGGLDAGESPVEWRARALEQLSECECYGGLDIGSVSDLTAFALVFDGTPMGYEDRIVLIPWVWCPAGALETKAQRYKDSYESWAKDGFMRITSGNATDYALVRDEIASIAARFNLVDVGADMQFQGHETAIFLQEHHGINVIGFSQGFMSMSSPTQDFEGRVRSGRIAHGNNPLLRWSVGHAMIASKGDLARPVKEARNSQKKIDPVVACLMALGRWHVRERDNPPSQYNAGERLTVF